MAALVGYAGPAGAEGLSIDAASPSVSAGSNSAFLSAGPVGGPPVVEETPADRGLSGGATDELNSMTFGGPGPGATLYFSVDRNSVGLTGDVVSEAALGQAAGDLYVWTWPALGSNVLAINQADLGLVPAIPAGMAATPPIDNLDAYDFDYDGPVMGVGTLSAFTLAPGHPYNGTAVGCGGDVFISSASFVLPYTTYFDVASCADDVDAYESDGTLDVVYFSLAPGSPSLAPGSPIGGCSAGCSPADIFRGSLNGTAFRWLTAADLGLLATDNVDAIAFGPGFPVDPPEEIPSASPGGVVLLVASLIAGVGWVRGRRGAVTSD